MSGFWSAPRQRRFFSPRQSGAVAHPAESARLWSVLRKQRFLPTARANTLVARSKSGALAPHSKTLARFAACCVESMKLWSALREQRSTSRILPLRRWLEPVQDLDAVDFESIDALDLRRRGGTFKPRRRTPEILVCDRHQAVFYRILVNVIQPGEVRPFVSQACVPEVVPNVSARLPIEPIDPTGRFGVKHPEHLREVFCGRHPNRRVGNEMIVIGEHRPSFQLPAVFLRQLEQPSLKDRQPVGTAEVMSFEVGGGRNEVDTRLGELMCRGVRPRVSRLDHGEKVADWMDLGKRGSVCCQVKSGAVAPHSKPLARLAECHILLGLDHLLFVLALLILTRQRFGVRRAAALFSRAVLEPYLPLVKTVTAFTVAHSITLGLATLGVVHIPSKPVEAVIALSIVFVAAEIVRTAHGQKGVTARAPWIVAFTFGLLHGFGFAGALSEVGLPHGHIPVALLFFNVGVEVGQLFFIVSVLTLISVVGFWSVPRQRRFLVETVEDNSDTLAPHSKMLVWSPGCGALE